MKLNEPKCCGECFFKNEGFNSPFCAYQMQTIQSETNARLDITIDLTSVPKWCPIKKTNKMIEELPIEKQRALDSISNGLQILFRERAVTIGYWYFWHPGTSWYGPITRWMPMPKLPKEGNEE